MNGFILCIICCSYIRFSCSLKLKAFCYQPIEIKNIIKKLQNLQLAQPPVKMAEKNTIEQERQLEPAIIYRKGMQTQGEKRSREKYLTHKKDCPTSRGNSATETGKCSWYITWEDKFGLFHIPRVTAISIVSGFMAIQEGESCKALTVYQVELFNSSFVYMIPLAMPFPFLSLILQHFGGDNSNLSQV